ncbi:ABC-2 type transport system permease protein [Kineothrix alysoides]|uniref:ABC-2 type transport system permease protein n=1 Tax=Kineothrix alysoides TaxID=1469948 RepID=A0A4R1QZW2_9FIRM|nr:ABC transporter permease [Kineothrix alysoides]TCL58541.1 ABC-2 type transport system permease protein [Kineothrix alysoides]
MSAFMYGVVLQWKLDIRSKSLLVTCYVVPLLFFAVMGGIFTSINPGAKYTLIQSMTVLGVSTGALVGLPPSLVEIYGSDIKKVYKANGVPLYLGMVSMFLSAFIHILIMCTIIYIVAPIAFDAALPASLPLYFVSLAAFIAVSLSIGCVLGLSVKNQAKLTMISQVIFLPSIMLSGIMLPVDLLPVFFKIAGKIFPATWGYKMMTDDTFYFGSLWPLAAILFGSIIVCIFLLKRLQKT